MQFPREQMCPFSLIYWSRWRTGCHWHKHKHCPGMPQAQSPGRTSLQSQPKAQAPLPCKAFRQAGCYRHICSTLANISEVFTALCAPSWFLQCCLRGQGGQGLPALPLERQQQQCGSPGFLTHCTAGFPITPSLRSSEKGAQSSGRYIYHAHTEE